VIKHKLLKVRLVQGRKLPQTYACRKCGRTYSLVEYEESRFCRDCAVYLMPESKVAKSLKKIRKAVKSKVSEKGMLPENYELRKGQMEFIQEATEALKSKRVFMGSAPCGIGKSLASLLAVLPQLEKDKLIVCFRTRSQLHIYLKELKALSRGLSVVSFFSKQDMCPLRMKARLSYIDFFEECKRLKENCESSTKPYCKFYWNNIRAKKQADELALDYAQKILPPNETVELMAMRGFCAYEALKRILNRVNVFLGTYHYVFDAGIRRTLLKSLGVDLSRVFLIVDEAHNLPSFARELLSDKLTRYTVESALKETDSFSHDSQALVREYLDILLDQVFQHAQRTLKREELKQLNPQKIGDLFLAGSGVSGLEVAGVLKEYGEYVKEKRLESGSERVLSYNYRVGTFIENFLGNDETGHIHLISKDKNDRVALEVRSFDGRMVTNPVLRQARGSVLMSGFLSPPEVYRDLTLSEPSSVCLKEFDSPFPPENRLIVVATDVSSEFKRRNSEMLGKWRSYIETISAANQGNIAVFFTSYGLMHKVLPLMRTNRKMIVELQKTSRIQVIEQMTNRSDNMLFGVMGGKLGEGIDYPNNILTCVVAVGLPYATWDVYQKALMEHLERQFPQKGRTYAYLAPAILRLIQTCGRVHRSANDKGCIVILDERVAHPHIKQQLPSYFQKEMRVVKSAVDCNELIKEFWKKPHALRPD
jgi:DNA excision repair protein ERCC-2